MASTPAQDAAYLAALKTWVATQGVAGPAGPQGPTGAAGPAGPAGPQGPAGGTAPVPTPTPAPSGIVWKTAVHNDWTPASQLTAYGNSYYVESAEKPHSVQISTNTDKPILRFELHDGELWTGALGGNDSERAELDGVGTKFAKGVEWWTAMSVIVDPATPPQLSTSGGYPGSDLAWGCLMQVYGGGPALQLSYVGDTLSVRTRIFPSQAEQTHWTLPKAQFVKGKIYDVIFRMKLTGTATASFTAWVDGVQVAQFTGLMGDPANTASNIKFGIYRGWQLNGYPPMIVYQANLAQGTASLLSRVTNSPSWPVVKP